jgi:biotin carboxylase
MTRRVLLLATTTGYQTRSFGEAAERLGIDLVFATDRCHVIEDPWRDQAIPIRFYDEAGALTAILESAASAPVDGIISVGDRPTVIGARAARALGLPGHPPEAAAVARDKRLTRARLADHGLPSPWFAISTADADPFELARSLPYPVVVKPAALSGSRGVIRADNPDQFAAAFKRLRAMLQSPEIRAERNDAHGAVLIEAFIPGHEYAIEGVMDHGVVQVLAIFDKPDPLDGPFFEETIYVTPPLTDPQVPPALVDAVTRAARAIGLEHGPIHAECRVNAEGVFVLEVAARPIGGLCARSLRFGPDPIISLEELLLRQAVGESTARWGREAAASGVLMIPIPNRGILRGVDGIEAARSVVGVADVRITAKTDQLLIPLPEGASYLGFIFARGEGAADAVRSLREAHARLRFTIDPEIPLRRPALQSRDG